MDDREARRLYSHQYRCDKIRGIKRTMPGELAVRHLRGLLDAGVTMSSISEASGTPLTTLSELLSGKHQRVSVKVGRRILAVTFEQALRTGKPLGRVPALGAIRRVQALLALGHTHRTICALLPNRDPSVTMKLIGRTEPGVMYRYLFEAICSAFEALSMQPGRSEQTRRRAKRRGYEPPLAWEEGAIDRPDAVPHGARIRCDVVDPVAVQRRMEGERVRVTQAEARAVCEALYRQGLSSPEVMRRTGLKPERYLTITEWRAAS